MLTSLNLAHLTSACQTYLTRVLRSPKEIMMSKHLHFPNVSCHCSYCCICSKAQSGGAIIRTSMNAAELNGVQSRAGVTILCPTSLTVSSRNLAHTKVCRLFFLTSYFKMISNIQNGYKNRRHTHTHKPPHISFTQILITFCLMSLLLLWELVSDTRALTSEYFSTYFLAWGRSLV